MQIPRCPCKTKSTTCSATSPGPAASSSQRTWYDAQKAHAHLRDKYKYLVGKNLADTTEHVIERAASESSMSGTPYQIRCVGAAAVSSRQWLREKLTELRAMQ